LAVVLAIALVLWFAGIDMPSSPATRDPWAVIEFLLNMFGAGLLLVGLYCVLWALSLPKRGIVSTLGLIVAVIAVALEFVP
jgi:hypothetical protein